MQREHIILRIGTDTVNWNNTTEFHTWGLPTTTVKQCTVNRLNAAIRRNNNAGIVVWFLANSKSANGNRIIASTIVTRPIRAYQVGVDTPDTALNWDPRDSNALTRKVNQRFGWRMRCGDILLLDDCREVRYRTIVRANDNTDVRQPTLTEPKREGLIRHLQELYVAKWIRV